MATAVSRSGGAQGVLQAKSAQPIQQSRVRKKNSVPGLAEALDEGPLKPATMPVKATRLVAWPVLLGRP
ncbi:unnamed protein product [Effrenium voratum]|nr:unnamed protein product [Effrenium voratum]